jgi:hypothetical protein
MNSNDFQYSLGGDFFSRAMKCSAVVLVAASAGGVMSWNGIMLLTPFIVFIIQSLRTYLMRRRMFIGTKAWKSLHTL